ncbi:hypothetical protein [Streptomyces stelliscabiei]|uniref:hypothetical protein n=1 Tax=Streptomyces stelliscabiei TaxID=146820 RepID=UPI0029B20FD8|nr:hypothetical protein [Streptomyces stelliscabiei]MDX2554723.1 hypothetical protein [Streptomyces stelliscabiei]MDX2613250.1 hypothetical protein [Streptomyces stelliscabiei]MDX2638474.1 hypothetical protein [Streptomyces stelliscabiei]MDX2661626.1 hypothetical protein [Streptomyces stelliscabiei]MDX2712241.1 hypothetical protein [Streptomyces stelliscabiei]
MPATPSALAAAHRARTIAAIARNRAENSAPVPNAEDRTALLDIAALMDTAVHSLETEEPGTWDGIVITNTIDWDASHALRTADEIAAAHPAIGFPPRFSQYVTAPVFGNEIDLPTSLLPGGPVLIAKEGDLFARLLALHGHYLAAPNGPEDAESIKAALKAAFTLHWKHALLAQSIAADTEHRSNRPAVPAAVEIPTPGTPMALRRAHDAYGPTVTYGLDDRRLPCHISDQGVTHTAVRMVSHLGATIATCDDDRHRNAAAVAARELYDSLG